MVTLIYLSMKLYLLKSPIQHGFKIWLRANAITGEFDAYTSKKVIGLGRSY